MWISTGRKEEVFDLLNCGPRNRFTIISASGPVIVHNCTQAVARDLLAEAMLRAEKAGFCTAIHVHDEIVAEVDEGKDELEKFIGILSETPSWAVGCPIKAEGWTGRRYRK